MRLLLARGYTDPSFPPPGDGDTSIIIYGYTPALSLAVVGAVSFGICALALTALLVRLRGNWVMLLTLLATLFEVVGYIARSLSASVDPYRLAFFVVQYFFIVCAPVFLSAAIYLAFGRLLNLLAPDNPPVKPRALFLCFLAFDIVTTVVQIAGAASIGTAESNGRDPTPANNALIAGLAVQVASFLVFLVLYVICVIRLSRRPSKPARSSGVVSKAWQLLAALLLLGVLVELRTAFRLAESAEGVMGRLSSSEPFFAGLEYVPIILVVVGMAWLSWELALLQRRAAAEAADPAAAV